MHGVCRVNQPRRFPPLRKKTAVKATIMIPHNMAMPYHAKKEIRVSSLIISGPLPLHVSQRLLVAIADKIGADDFQWQPG